MPSQEAAAFTDSFTLSRGPLQRRLHPRDTGNIPRSTAVPPASDCWGEQREVSACAPEVKMAKVKVLYRGLSV